MSAPVLVAIDGPSGSGKSSVSKEAARRLGYAYLDTGAAYRVLGWLSIARGLDRTDPAAIAALVASGAYAPPLDPDRQQIIADGQDVTAAIRTDEASLAASEVARLIPVREALNEGFRRIAASVDAPGIVVEGRDITTVVAPDAPVRVLLVADPLVRAARRARELGESEEEAIAEAMRLRDASDAGVVNFLSAAPGVETLDSSNLDFEQTVAAVLELIRRNAGQKR